MESIHFSSSRQRRRRLAAQQLSHFFPLPRPSFVPPPGAIRGRCLLWKIAGEPIQCNSCFKWFPVKDLVLCYCYHSYCAECVVEMVQAAVAIDYMHPVRCCKMMIPLHWKALNVPQETADMYNRRRMELEARAAVYCYQNTCRALIHPQYIIHDEAICDICQSSTCARCGGAFHEGLACGV